MSAYDDKPTNVSATASDQEGTRKMVKALWFEYASAETSAPLMYCVTAVSPIT
jgi:hypothetical protein